MQKIHRFSLSGYELMPEEVFISYGSADRERIQDLVSRLRQAGVTVWIDEAGIEGAAMWSEEIVSAINHCKVLILSISSNSTKSKNVVRELALASEEEKTILPVFIESTEIPESMKYQLAGIQRVEYFAGKEEEAIGSVLRALSRLGITTNDSEPGQAPGQATTAPTHAKRKSPALAIAAVAVFALLSAIFLFKPSDEQPADEPSAPATKPESSATQPEAKPLDKNRIVLLPFKNIGTPGENDHIVEGIVDDLNTMLTNVDGLRVIGSASAKTYRDSDKTPSEIGNELNAGTLLQGSIQKAGSNLKINVRLIDTTTSENIWANSFNGSEKDRIKFQKEIIQSIVNKTKGTILNKSQLGTLTQSDTQSAKAYALVKEANSLTRTFSREGVSKAIKLFKQAIEIDPTYADAHVGLCRAEMDSSGVSLKPTKESIPIAKKHLEKALLLNPNHIEAKLYKAWITLKFDMDGNSAMAQLQNLLKLYPNHIMVLKTTGQFYAFAGRESKALELLKKVSSIDPKDSRVLTNIALCYYLLGEYEKAEKNNDISLSYTPNFQWGLHLQSIIKSKKGDFEKIISQLQDQAKLDNYNPVTMMSLGTVYWKSGQKEKSYKVLAELLDRRHFEYIKGGIIARLYMAMEDHEKAIKWTKVSREEKDSDFFHLYFMPFFIPLQSNYEFSQIFKDAGIYPFYNLN